MRLRRYREREWIVQYVGKKGKPEEKYDLKGLRGVLDDRKRVALLRESDS